MKEKSPGARRLGYLIAIVVNVILLYLFNYWVPAQDFRVLLEDKYFQILPVLNFSIWLTIGINILQLAVDPFWLRVSLKTVQNAVGIYFMYLLFVVFPFDLTPMLGGAWNIYFRYIFLLAAIATLIGTVIELVKAVASDKRQETSDM